MKKNNIVLVGGGSTWTPGILKAMTTHLDQFALNRVVLYDVDQKRQEVIGEFAKILFKEEAPEVEVVYTTDKEVAYKEVDFVFCQMRTVDLICVKKMKRFPFNMASLVKKRVDRGALVTDCVRFVIWKRWYVTYAS